MECTSRQQKVPSLLAEDGDFYRFEQMSKFHERQVGRIGNRISGADRVCAGGWVKAKPFGSAFAALWQPHRHLRSDLWIGKRVSIALRVIGQRRIESVQSQQLPCIDYDFLDSSSLDPSEKSARFCATSARIAQWVSEWAMHPGLDNAELRAIQSTDSLIRQRTLDFLTSPEARAVVNTEGIILLDYRPLQTIWSGAQK